MIKYVLDFQNTINACKNYYNSLKFIVKKFKKWNFASETLAVHLLQAEYAHAEDAERVVSHMNDHMLWGNDFTSEVIAQSLEEGLIKKSGNKLSLTALGREKAKNIISKN